MKCVTCETEINPKWGHAIDTNVCPFCGKSIMDEYLKNLFSSLRSTMDDLQKYPEQLNDWLLSNHNYIKTDSPELDKFLPKDYLKDHVKEQLLLDQEKKFQKKTTIKVQTDTGEEDIESEKIQSEEKTNDFFKRAEAVKPNIDGFNSTTEKTQHYKNLVQQIRKSGARPQSNDSSTEMITPEMMDQADPEAVAEIESLLSGGDTISSALQSSDDDEIPSVVLAMANKGARGGGSSNNADLIKLQQMHDRVKNSRENFESGASRGSKGGSFSRS